MFVIYYIIEAVIMGKYFGKLISIIIILSLFSGCMTIEKNNRSEAVSELKKLSKYSISRVPLENTIGPVYRIGAPSNNSALMIAGQTGLELNYKYFILIDSNLNQNISGYMYQGIGGLSTENIYSITIAFTNDENYELKYNSYECSTLLDDFTFVTHNGRITLWTLFGATLIGGSALFISGAVVDDDTYTGRFIGGGALMLGSMLFTIPLW